MSTVPQHPIYRDHLEVSDIVTNPTSGVETHDTIIIIIIIIIIILIIIIIIEKTHQHRCKRQTTKLKFKLV